MALEPNKIYMVTKRNTKGNILTDDLVYIDDDGVLVIHTSGELAPFVAHGCIEKDEQTQFIMDFECVCVD